MHEMKVKYQNVHPDCLCIGNTLIAAETPAACEVRTICLSP